MKSFNLFFKTYFRNCFSLLCYIPLTIILVSMIILSCSTTKKVPLQNQKVEMTSNNDSTEHTLIVLDPGFESYLISKPSAHFYSQQYYESWNDRYVREWNARHRDPLRYGPFYETEIFYDLAEDYGLDLNYRLYYYFQFIKDQYGIVLIGRGR